MSIILTKDARGNLVRERPLSDSLTDGERDTRDGPEKFGAECEDGYAYRFNTGSGQLDRHVSKRR